MQTIIHSTTIVTADDACSVQYDAAIAINGDRIVAIGPYAKLLARYPAAERIDGHGKVVMPGFAKRRRQSRMAKQVITSDKLYPVYGSYSHAVRVGDLVFLYGTVGFDAHGRLPGDIPGQTDMVGQGGELCHVHPW